MPLKASHLTSHAGAVDCGSEADRLSFPFIPTLLCTLAVLNVASVVFVLVE